MKRKTIVIDLATIYPGRGGAGGGIWSYTKNLLEGIDSATGPNEEFEFVCLVNDHFNLLLNNITIKRLPYNLQNFAMRFLYVHFYLPFYVLFKRGVLHKVYFEVPIWTPFSTLVTIHDCMGDFYKKKGYGTFSVVQQIKRLYFSWINKWAIRKSTLIVTPSQFVKSELVTRYAISPEKVYVTPLATSSFERKKRECTGPDKAIKIYCVAAFHPHKGQLRVIDIIEVLCKKHNMDLHLFFRGHVHDTAYFQSVRKRIEASALQDRIHILSYEVNSSLQQIYDDADWLILLSEYEGFGLPVIEAQANGVPVICSDIGTFKEVAGDTVFYLGEALDHKTAAKELCTILADENYKGVLVQKGHKNVPNYNWRRFTKEMMEVYKSLN